uniref:Uncharacterized protein n=1 Tax=Rhizophora mucronata TaxID=61149 RepID=A0A2P2QRV7_RHIMU
MVDSFIYFLFEQTCPGKNRTSGYDLDQNFAVPYPPKPSLLKQETQNCWFHKPE